MLVHTGTPDIPDMICRASCPNAVQQVDCVEEVCGRGGRIAVLRPLVCFGGLPVRRFDRSDQSIFSNWATAQLLAAVAASLTQNNQ